MLKLGLMRAPLAAILLLGTVTSALPASAQPVVVETPGAALSRYIRVLATSPHDFNALIGAGKAALELGDVQAAAGFFGRAEEVNANAPAAKVGLGAAMAHMGDADGAIFYFNQASKLGAPPMVMATDRGMARDLQGDLEGAQADYRLAIASLGSDEARRRLALSLAIGRNRKAALDTIQPLLNRHDAAAQRTRAFILALVGDQIAAAQAIEAVMPGASARFAPFFRYLPNLSVAEKAAAVHLGIFPEDASTRVASIDAATPQPVAAAPAGQPPIRGAVNAAPPANQVRRPSEPVEPIPVLAAAEETAAETNLSGIDKLLATIAEPMPPPGPVQPGVASSSLEVKKAAPAGSDKAARVAAAKKAAEKKAREERLAAEKKAREEEAKLGVKGTHWVQLAGGSNQDRMALEYKKLSARAGRLLKSRSGYVTGGKEYFRLLVGPFNSKSESQAFVNKLEKEGVDGFSWTRTPPKIRIEKLSST